MTKPESESGDVFDVQNFGTLMELMSTHDVSEVDIRRGDVRIRLRRGALVAAAPAPVAAAAAPAARPAPAAEAAAPTAAAASDENKALIKSPMVGTFYTASSPDAPAYVKVGDRVGPETAVCIVEAMKVFNEIPAEISGKITAVLVENGAPVEFNQPLFEVDTRG